MITQDELRQALHYDPKTGTFTWKVSGNGRRIGKVAGYDNGNGYWRITQKDKPYFAHRLAWFYIHGEWPPLLDHRDGNGLNNRIANLRLATSAQNAANRRPRAALKGTSRHRGKWQASICHAGWKLWLGSFDTAEKAHATYCEVARKLRGDFARVEG